MEELSSEERELIVAAPRLGRQKMAKVIVALQIAASQLQEATEELAGVEVPLKSWVRVDDEAKRAARLVAAVIKLRDQLADAGALRATNPVFGSGKSVDRAQREAEFRAHAAGCPACRENGRCPVGDKLLSYI